MTTLQAPECFAPQCIHVPRLYQQQMVDVTFEDTGAETYELQYVVDSDSEDTTPGVTWKGISLKEASWNDIDTYSHTWSALEGLNNVIDITTISGEGNSYLGTDVGLTWSEIGEHEGSWNYLDDLKTWNEIELLSSIGLSWDSIDSKSRSWDEMVLELDTKDILWDWDYLDSLSADIDPHKGFGVEVPEGRYMKFRVASEDQTGISDYIVSDDERIVTADTFEGFIKANEAFIIHLDSDLVKSFRGTVFTLFYTSNAALSILDKAAKHIKGYKERITFEKDRYIEQYDVSEDVVVSIPFISQKTGNVRIQAEYIRK